MPPLRHFFVTGRGELANGKIRMQPERILYAVRVYERYSVTGSNRVSLSVTLLGKGEELMLCAITSGGSQAAFFKINTWGEEAFLEQVERAVHNYERRDIR